MIMMACHYDDVLEASQMMSRNSEAIQSRHFAGSTLGCYLFCGGVFKLPIHQRLVRKTIRRCRDKTAMLPVLGGRLLSEASEFVEDEALDGI
ncbi:hypothetical protein CEXT_545411 [Caerostris extrusa]|uniref:Uncharacterized protein n=1 Tax=Caerostris extrusa TaxID=172846 RepID=A0AAV4QKI2_CAEEX|nr:hypothetical protein CEXT_545411 [Caerostris extrusa]